MTATPNSFAEIRKSMKTQQLEQLQVITQKYQQFIIFYNISRTQEAEKKYAETMQIRTNGRSKVKHSKNSQKLLRKNICTLKNLSKCKVDDILDQNEKAAKTLLKKVAYQNKEVVKMRSKFYESISLLDADICDDKGSVEKFGELLPAGETEIKQANEVLSALKENEKIVLNVTAATAQQREELVSLSKELMDAGSLNFVSEVERIQKDCEEDTKMISLAEAQSKDFEKVLTDLTHLVKRFPIFNVSMCHKKYLYRKASFITRILISLILILAFAKKS
jgi:hypothetical protein